MEQNEAVALVHEALEESARIRHAMRALAPDVARAADRVAEAFRGGGRLFACGNGGSACDAMHLVEELVARYKRDRPGLAAHHLLDAPTLTCWSNDHDFASAFRRQVEALARPGDVLVVLSTSGRSANVVQAVEAARAGGVWTLGLAGGDGGALAALADLCLTVPSAATERVQEGHITLVHLLCELVERTLFPGDGPWDRPGAPPAPGERR
jgi:D-sedoheptulose 7-phosphate isomerase